MVYALALLLFSSLTCVGLLAIWAATAPQHWFLRTILFLGVISLVLLIPAYEPFVAFLLQGAVVAAGVQLARWWQNRKTVVKRPGARFALRTILLAIVSVAVLTAVAVRLPELNFRAWQSVVLIGLCAGGATLVGLWIVRETIVSWSWRFLIGSAIAGGLSLPLVCGDWFIAGVEYWQWPPPLDDGVEYLGSIFAEYRIVSEHKKSAWIVILSFLACSVAIVMWLMQFSEILSKQSQKRIISAVTRVLTSALLFLLTLALLVPSLGIYYQLMNPLPIPFYELPNPNGYDDFLAAIKLLPTRPLVDGVNYDPDKATLGQLRTASKELEPAINRSLKGLNSKIWHQLNYSNNSDKGSQLAGFRTVLLGLITDGLLAEKENQESRATDTYVDMIHYGTCLGRGTLTGTCRVGFIITEAGCRNLYRICDIIPAKQVPAIITKLSQFEANFENPEDVLHRERVWTQRALGWTVHLGKIAWELFEESPYDTFYFRQEDGNARAILRLLQLEFALRAWKAEHGGWPESLTEMVPVIIPAVPLDPFSPVGSSLQYYRTDDGYVLYSVGQNEIDEGGVAPEDDGSGWRDPTTGDLRLDIQFAPDPPVNLGAGNEDMENE